MLTKNNIKILHKHLIQSKNAMLNAGLKNMQMNNNIKLMLINKCLKKNLIYF